MKLKSTVSKAVCAALLLSTASLLQAKDIYLSPQGDDKADGLSVATAVKTFSRANSLVENGDVVRVSGFINMMNEPNDPQRPKHGDINVDGSVEYEVNGVIYNTWNIGGKGGVKMLNKEFTVVGDNKTTCGFDGAEQTRIFRIDGALKKVTFKNLTFKNGNSELDTDQGSGLYIRSAAPDFENCDFVHNGSISTANGSQEGGAIFYNPGRDDVYSTFKKCTFKGNFSKQGGAFHILSSRLDILDCLFEANGDNTISGSRGGAFFIKQSSAKPTVLTVKNTVMINNSVYADGAAVHYEDMGGTTTGSTIYFESCAFITNKCTLNGNGGAISIKNSVVGNLLQFTVVNSTLFGNEANAGGGVYVQTGVTGSELLVVNCTLTENKCAQAGAGGGFRFHDETNDGTAPNSTKNINKKIYNCIVENNSTLNDGRRDDLSVRFYEPSPANLLFLENSFFGMPRVDLSAEYYGATNLFRYDTDPTEKVSKAKFADPTSFFIEEYNCIPVDHTTSEAINFGNADYLKNLNLAVDQLGKTRPFLNNKCNIGAVEVDEDNMEPTSLGKISKDIYNVYVYDNQLMIEGDVVDNLNITIYDLTGVAVATYRNVSTSTLPLPVGLKGIYLINIQNNVVKKVVI